MHISTLYSNCNRQHIDEKVYDMEIGYEKIIQVSFLFDSVYLYIIYHRKVFGVAQKKIHGYFLLIFFFERGRRLNENQFCGC